MAGVAITVKREGVGKIMNYDLIQKVNNKIPHHTKICIIVGMLAGWFTHFYMLTHKLPNWDDATNLSMYGSGDFLGRWFLKYIHRLGTRYSIPAIHGVLMIFILTIAACLVLEILHLKSTTAAILVPALMVTFPSVACTMTFMFMSHTSAIAIFMICLAVYLLRKYKWGFVPCTVFLICSLGVYQSYISIAIALMLLGMIVDILEDKDVWKTLRHGILCVVVLLVTVGIYMWLCHVIYPNIDNQEYGGIGNMGDIAISEMPRLIARCYKRFLEFFIWKPFSFMTKTMQIMNICTCVLAAFLGVYVMVVKKIYQNVWNFVLLCALAVFVPLAAAFVYFMAPEANYSMLMLYAYVLIYVAVIMLLEKAADVWEKQDYAGDKKRMLFCNVVSLAVVVVMSVSCYANYLVSNKAYLRMEISYERVTSYFNRIIASVEATEGYQNGDAVAILGEFHHEQKPSPVEAIDVLDTEELRDMSGVALENGLITSGVRNDFIETFIGFDMADLSGETKKEIMASQQYLNMPVYPAKGAIQQINGVWVVKMCEE